MHQPEKVLLRIDVAPMPVLWCTDLSLVRLGLQSKRGEITSGIKSADGCTFELEVGIKDGRGRAPDFFGDMVHGRPGERFLYLSWGQVTPESEHKMFRRLKVYLSPVVRKDWSSDGVSWAQVEAGVAQTTISGRGPDGTPNCGTAAASWR